MDRRALKILTVCLFASFVLPGQTMYELIGINTRAKDPVFRISQWSYVRDYHDWNPDPPLDQNNQPSRPFEPSYSQLQWNPSRDGAAVYNYDEYYGYSGMWRKTVPVLKGLAPEQRGFNDPNIFNFGSVLLDQKPFFHPELPPWSGCFDAADPNCLPGLFSPDATDQEDPEVFLGHSRWLTHFAVRYGFTNAAAYQQFFADDLAPTETFRHRQRWLRYLENQNEPDKTWHDEGLISTTENPVPFVNPLLSPSDDDGLYGIDDILTGFSRWHHSPAQYAAMLSADYDGHGRQEAFRLGTSDLFLGVHNADPGTKLVMAGLADLRGQYALDVREWMTDNRPDGDIAFDVLNFHHYSSDYNPEDGVTGPIVDENKFDLIFDRVAGTPLGTHGVAPEEEALVRKLELLRTKLTQGGYAQDMEMWLSEFGYDSHPLSQQAAVPDFSPDWPEGGQMLTVYEGLPEEQTVTLAAVTEGFSLRTLLRPWRAGCDNGPVTPTLQEGFIRKAWAQLSEVNRNYLFAITHRAQADWLMRSYLEIAASQEIDRAFMFCIRDDDSRRDIPIDIYVGNDPDLGICQEFVPSTAILDYLFRTSGMLTDEESGFKPKRSWYYVKTLQRVLGAYTFFQDVSPSFDSDVRVLAFRQGDENKALVVWSTDPTLDSELEVDFSITIPNTFNIGEDAPITRVDPRLLDENGRRRLLAPSNYSISADGMSISFEDFILSQTPTILLLDKDDPDPVVPPVTGLPPTNLCCNSVRLDWVRPPGAQFLYDKYHIYFRERLGDQDDGSNFDLTNVTTFTETLPGERTSAVISGLRPGAEFIFYIIPMSTGNNVPTALPGTLVFHTVGSNCSSSDCFVVPSTIEIENPEQIVDGAGGANVADLNFALQTAFISHNNPPGDLCTELTAASAEPFPLDGTAPAWVNNTNVAPVEVDDPDEPVRVVVEFDQPYNFSSIQYFDSYGSERIHVEYFDCYCWRNLGEMIVRGGRINLESFDNFVSPNRSITKFRFTFLDDESQLSHVFFCGTPVECNEPDGSPSGGLTGGNTPSDEDDNGEEAADIITDITTNSALLKWETDREYRGDPQSNRVSSYRVLLSDQYNELSGELIGPEEYAVHLQPNAREGQLSFDELSPATTYYLARLPDPTRYPCLGKAPDDRPTVREFTTLGRPAGRSAKADSSPVPPPLFRGDLRLSPNPVALRLKVDLPRRGYEEAYVYDPRGQLVMRVPVDSELYGFYLDTGNLPSGTYRLIVQGRFLPPRDAVFVVLR